MMETHVSQSLVRVAVPSRVFQHVPKHFFRCGCERCNHWLESCGNCHHVGDCVPLCTATHSAMGATYVAVPRGPVKLVGDLGSYMAREHVVVHPEVCARFIIDFALPLPTGGCVRHSNGRRPSALHAFVHPKLFEHVSSLNVGPTLRRLSCRVVVPLAVVVTLAAPADCFRVSCTISFPLLLVQRLTLEEFVLEPPGNRGGIPSTGSSRRLLCLRPCDETNRAAGSRGWSRRRLPVHRATTCAHFILKGGNYRQFFSPPCFRQKRRAHVSCPDLLGRCSRK